MIVKSDKAEGYIRSALVSRNWISVPQYGGAGSQGHNSGGSASSGGADGGDITLGVTPSRNIYPVLLSTHREYQPSDNSVSFSEGAILADGVELYLGIVYPGDELMVLSENNTTAEIYTSRGIGTLPRWAVLVGDEDPYETWNGYAGYEAKLYDSYRLAGASVDIKLNTELTVIMETDNGLFVQLPDGRFGYMAKSTVSRNMTVVYYEEPGKRADSSPVSEWTDPVL